MDLRPLRIDPQLASLSIPAGNRDGVNQRMRASMNPLPEGSRVGANRQKLLIADTQGGARRGQTYWMIYVGLSGTMSSPGLLHCLELQMNRFLGMQCDFIQLLALPLGLVVSSVAHLLCHGCALLSSGWRSCRSLGFLLALVVMHI